MSLLQRLSVVCIGAVCLLAIDGPSTAQVSSAPAANRFGFVDDLYITNPVALTRMREAGLGWASYYLYWNRANPAPGVYDWSGPDFEIAEMRNAGLNVFVHIVWPPAWTTGVSYPNDLVPLFCFDDT
ncbi:MAG: hypothetical protein U0Q12_10440, partial [Vicinamibacterales bacterium]